MLNYPIGSTVLAYDCFTTLFTYIRLNTIYHDDDDDGDDAYITHTSNGDDGHVFGVLPPAGIRPFLFHDGFPVTVVLGTNLFLNSYIFDLKESHISFTLLLHSDVKKLSVQFVRIRLFLIPW